MDYYKILNVNIFASVLLLISLKRLLRLMMSYLTKKREWNIMLSI